MAFPTLCVEGLAKHTDVTPTVVFIVSCNAGHSHDAHFPKLNSCSIDVNIFTVKQTWSNFP